MNYYSEIITKIQDLIDLKQYKKSYDLVTTELSMPYIPKKYEDKFKILKTTINEFLLNSAKESKTNFDKDTIFKILQSDNDPLAPLAISQLKDLNLQNSINDIIKIFKNTTLKCSIKVVIFEYLVEQNINLDLEVSTPYESKNISTTHSLIESSDYKKLINILETTLNKNPSLLQIATSYVNQFVINLFPSAYIYENNDEIIFINIAKNAIGNPTILSTKYQSKSLYINEILKRYI